MNIEEKNILSLIAHKELANVINSLSDEVTLADLFAGNCTITFPVSLHQDMINVEILKHFWPKDIALPTLLENGSSITKE